MNFATEVLHKMRLSDSAVESRPGDAYGVFLALDALRQSKKFVVPPPDKLHITVRSSALDFLKSPYPYWSVEYTCPQSSARPAVDGVGETGKSTKRIAVCISLKLKDHPLVQRVRQQHETIRDDTEGFIVISIYYYDDHELWSMGSGYAVVTKEFLADEDGEHKLLLNDKQFYLNLVTLPLLSDIAVDIAMKYELRGHTFDESITYSQNVMRNDIWEETATAIRVAIMMSAHNVTAVPVNDPSPKLNKKRLLNDKPPFFQYHTLDLFLSDTQIRPTKRMSVEQVMRLFESRKQVGLHAVDVHLKVRKTGVFLWRKHLRGSGPTKKPPKTSFEGHTEG